MLAQEIRVCKVEFEGNSEEQSLTLGWRSLLKPDQTNMNTVIQETKGYVALEWHRNQPMSIKAMYIALEI